MKCSRKNSIKMKNNAWVFVFQKYILNFWSISLEHFIKQKAFISKQWVFNFFLLRGIITKLGQSWTLHSLTAQERLLVILYRRKIYSSLEEEWCVVVVSNAYCTNLWGTFLCQNTPSVSLFGTKHLQNKKICVCSFTIIMYLRYLPKIYSY